MEIAAKIIEIARKRVTKTSIMYGAALSYIQLIDYLEFLQANELLEYTLENRLYHTTEKGMRFLNGYQELQHMLYPKKESEELLLKKSKV
jgi:predicted transcriptional regulator